MDSLNFHNVKFDKSHAKLRFRRMQRITALFRLMELCIFFFMVSRFTAQIPGAFRISGEYFHGLCSLSLSGVISPRFVFIIGNAIVITLFLKSRKLSAATDKDTTTNLSVGERTKFDLYEEYAKTCEKNRTLCTEMEKMDSPSNVVKKQRKPGKSMVKLERSHSESPMVVERVQPESAAEGGGDRKLRRSLTVKYKESSVKSEEKPAYAEDHLSGDEFRQTVEAFIARQQRFLREED